MNESLLSRLERIEITVGRAILLFTAGFLAGTFATALVLHIL